MADGIEPSRFHDFQVARELFVLESYGLPNDTYELFYMVILLYAKTSQISLFHPYLYTNCFA